MKVVILAGGFGTRLSEETSLIPKPMIKIGNLPIICHIMNIYSYYGFNDFYIALGYKGELIKKYFSDFNKINHDFCVNLKDRKITIINKNNNYNWKVNLIDTGLSTMTGGRVKQLEKYVGNETFLLTYGDGVADYKRVLEEMGSKNIAV